MCQMNTCVPSFLVKRLSDKELKQKMLDSLKSQYCSLKYVSISYGFEKYIFRNSKSILCKLIKQCISSKNSLPLFLVTNIPLSMMLQNQLNIQHICT